MIPSPAQDGSPGSNSFSGAQSRHPHFSEDPKPTIVPMEQTASERLQRLIRDCGYSKERLQTMYDELPPQNLRDDLIKYFFLNL